MKTSLASPSGLARPHVRRWRFVTAGLLSIGLTALFAPLPAHAQAAHAPLPYSNGFLVTGNHVVGGVDLTASINPSVGGFSTGTINIASVPANADILAAYLYWETIHLTSVTSPEAGVQFDGSDVTDPNVPLLKKTDADLG